MNSLLIEIQCIARHLHMQDVFLRIILRYYLVGIGID